MREQLRVADLRRSKRRLTQAPRRHPASVSELSPESLMAWLNFVEACDQQRETTLHFAPVVAAGSWS